ncbi:Rho/RAC guanine nucleotide exchange factor, putative [Entamoeba invadens IP1]|uniref:Rho/RAC guanine nucleotide exchange factor, putative n=1 Tax=Entamoeba invadens IP1 TaxID=370355 RepID=A0A0A1TXC8_ENTIV|nr:Rho/RAC guanine nucleotide exchange factor, putative [Entamoeba invadens IP1]ELP85970.1 Rho/RAC guanine nucleotide exchange factor, putative [Entamoeba invadens IP1]|eukprot:XP_004185316.1 Rho/RAC guanine nucleotide exchange factor, putative [Entamoeba invadens IP1]
MSLSKDDYRERIITEIVDTEVTYVDSLHTCMVYYYEHFLNDTPQVISTKQTEDIFLFFDQVYNTNKQFLLDIQSSKVAQTLSQNIGELFKNFIPYFRVYYQFLGNTAISLHTLTQLEQSKTIANYFEKLRIAIPGQNKLDVRGFLIMPVQRLPRYNLLLTDLLKNTPQTHTDYPYLIVALKEMKKLTDSANKAITAAERRRKLFLVETRISGFSGTLVEPHRVFLKEGSLRKVCRKTTKSRYFFLFNDILIYGSGDQSHVSVSQVSDVVNIVVKDIPTSVNSFEIFTDKKSFIVFAENVVEKREWMDELEKAAKAEVENLKTRNKESDAFIKPLFVPDDSVTKCMLCGKQFCCFERRHHCRFCGKCICDDCSKYRMPLPPLNLLERGCSACFDRLVLSARPVDKDKIRSSIYGNSSVDSTNY